MSISDARAAEINAAAKKWLDVAFPNHPADFMCSGEVVALIARMRAAEAERDDLRQRKDLAYSERNHVVIALAKCAAALGYRVGIAKTAIEGWSEDWHGCIYIDLPTGQVSWHYHDSLAAMFACFPAYREKWDGHDTVEKYRRVDALSADGLRTKLAEAEAVVAKLPKTADGVPVVPGMLLYSRSEWTARMTAVLNAPEFEANTHIDCMYSSEAAASASRAGGLA